MTQELSPSKQKKKYPVLFSLLLGIFLTLVVSIAAAVGQILELEDNSLLVVQGLGFLVMALCLTLYMLKKDSTLKLFGFRKISIAEYKPVLYYIPLLCIALVQPIYGGFNAQLTIGSVFTIILFSLIVGYTEEVLFRGILYQQLIHKGRTFFILFSAIFFGVLHIANAFSGKDIAEVLLQILNAFLIGLILALLIERSHHIWPLIMFHFLFDALAQLSDPIIEQHTVTIISILNVLYVLYGIYLLLTINNRSTAQSISSSV